jgi:hypothetical protein
MDPTPGSERSSQLHKVYQSRCTAKNSWWWTERLPETCRIVIPIKLELCAYFGFIHKESVTMRGHTICYDARSYDRKIKSCIWLHYIDTYMLCTLLWPRVSTYTLLLFQSTLQNLFLCCCVFLPPIVTFMWQGSGENYTMRSFMICTLHPILSGWQNREEWDRWGM